MASNRSIVLHGKHDLRIEDTPAPEAPKDNELLLKPLFCGICGTDYHLLEEGSVGDYLIEKPVVLGHEASATVVQVGAKVKKFKPGDLVTLEPAIPCLDCKFCLTGNYNLCDVCNNSVSGLPPRHGFFRSLFTHPATFCYKVASHVTPEEAAMTEPVACALHGVQRAKVRPGQNVLVCGSGTIGLLSMLVAKAFGAGKVVVSDMNEKRLDLAKKMGADGVIQVTKMMSEEEFVHQVQKQFGDRADVTLECTGAEISVNNAIMATVNGGRVAVVGLGPERVTIPLVKASLREVDLIGVCRFRNAFPLAVHLIESGRVDVKPLMTHKFKIEEAFQAFEAVKKQTGIKIMIQL